MQGSEYEELPHPGRCINSRRPPTFSAPIQSLVYLFGARLAFARPHADVVKRMGNDVVEELDLTALHLERDAELRHAGDEAERAPSGHQEVAERLSCGTVGRRIRPRA